MKTVSAQFTWLTKYADVVDCILTWYPDNPFAVHASFLNPNGDPVEWTFGLELLTDITEGRYSMTGLGDVRTARIGALHATQFHLNLRSPFGNIELVTLMTVISEFTDRVKEEMGTDEAVVDIDLAISRLLGDEWGGN